MSSLEFLVKTAIVCGRLVVLLPVVVHHTMQYYIVYSLTILMMKTRNSENKTSGKKRVRVEHAADTPRMTHSAKYQQQSTTSQPITTPNTAQL